MVEEECEDGKRELVQNRREGQQGVDLSRAWGHPIRQNENW